MSETKLIDIKELKFDEHNFNRHNDEGMSLLEKSIKENGLGRSILLDKDNNIVGGNGVTEKAIELGKTKVRIIETDGTELIAVKRTDLALDSKEGRELALADNSVANVNLEWDADELQKAADEWGIVPEEWGVEMPDFGLPDEQAVETVEEDNFEIEDNIETKVKAGEVWQLGEHRLMCGDSTDADAVAKLMNGERAQMTFSDAPYNIDFKGSMSRTSKDGVMVKHNPANTRHEAIHNDKMNKDDFFAFMMKILENIKQNVTGAWYLSFSSMNLEELLNPLRASGMDWKAIVIWMKNQTPFSMKDYKSRYEPIVYGRFNDDFYGNRGYEEDIWEYQRTLKNDLHPTMKPVPLIGKMVTDGSKEGDIVLDLFGGSGSTMIACEQLKRKCRMMELDPHYCTVIISRWEQHTGLKAERL